MSWFKHWQSLLMWELLGVSSTGAEKGKWSKLFQLKEKCVAASERGWFKTSPFSFYTMQKRQKRAGFGLENFHCVDWIRSIFCYILGFVFACFFVVLSMFAIFVSAFCWIYHLQHVSVVVFLFSIISKIKSKILGRDACLSLLATVVCQLRCFESLNVFDLPSIMWNHNQLNSAK